MKALLLVTILVLYALGVWVGASDSWVPVALSIGVGFALGWWVAGL